jgi:hypothetical protein
MSLTASSFEAAALRPALRRTEALGGALLWLAAASGALVFIEPSPYEVFTLLAMIVFVAAGLTLRSALLPFAALLVLVNIGYSISAAPLMERSAVVTWVLTSWYLAATALFFAAALSVNTAERLSFITRGYMVAAVVASVAAIAGYFRLLPGSEDLLLYGRARGTFKDPNVLGAFLVLPVLLALGRVTAGRAADALRGVALLVLFTAAALLSFSRGAWGQIVLASAVMLFLTFVTTASPNQRMRIVVVTVAAAALACLFVAALLSIDVVADLFKERAGLRRRPNRPFRPASARRRPGARCSIRNRAAAVQPVLPRRPAQFVSQRLHVGRLAQRALLSDLGDAHASPRLALRVRQHALAAGHHRGLCRFRRRRRREPDHRYRSLAALLFAARPALGFDRRHAGACRRAGDRNSCAAPARTLATGPAERSAARLAH